MKILAAAMAIAVALTWPAVGEAQGKKTKAHSASGTQQHSVRHAKAKRTSVKPTAGAKPCAARTYAGCQGRDPDPNVRMMIQMDAGRDDQ